MNRSRAWLTILPVLAAGVLAAHGLAYRLTGTPLEPAHDYLAHAPQVLLMLAVLGMVTAAVGAPLRLPAAWQLPVAALAAFVLQENVEHIVHTGRLPWLLATPAFLVGLLLQLPVALLAWLLSRLLLDGLTAGRAARTRRVPRRLLPIALPGALAARQVLGPPLPGRGPPPQVEP